MSTPQKSNIAQWLRSRTGLALIVFLVIAAFFLITEHTAHLFGVLPYALLFLSLLMFLFLRQDKAAARGDNTQAKDKK